jgi:hypothetical protein
MASESVQLNTRVPSVIHRDLERLAKRERTTITHEVNIALRAHIDADKRRRAA